MAWPYKQVNIGKEKKRDDSTGQNEGQPPFSTVHVISLKHTTHNLNPVAYINFSGLHPKNTTPLHHFKIQFFHKTSELPWSSWLTKTEEKSARQAEHQAWHTGENLEAITSTHFHTPVSELKLMLAKALIQQPHLVLPTSYSVSDGCFWWPKEKPASSGSEAENSTLLRMHLAITKGFGVPNIPPLHILLHLPPQSTRSFQ